jgi:hypothetical protein
MQDTEAKINNLMALTMEEIVNKEVEVKVVHDVKEILQKFIEAWKSTTQQA